MTNLLSPSIEKRALEMIANGMDVLEAVKEAILQENRMIESCLGSGFLSEKGKVARDYCADKMWNKINNKAAA